MMQSPGAAGPSTGVTTSQSPPFAVPIRYMLLGVICFGLFAVDFAISSGSVAQGVPGAPRIIALTHALTLGALLSFVMGAVYQLTTVAFLIPIASVPAARWNFYLYLVAFIGLFISMARWWTPGLLVFGSCMVLAIYIYAVVLIVSLMRTKIRGPMFGFVVSAHVHLILAVSAALLLILSDTGLVPALGRWMGPLLASHILLAMGGYFTFLVMGFSLKLLPMFTLSHGFATHRHKWTLMLAHLSLWVVITGVWTHLNVLMWTGAVIGIAAFVSQVLSMREIVQKRMRKRLEPPIRGVVAAAAGGAVGLCLLVLRLVFAQGEAGWQGVVMFYLLGVVTLTVMSFAYKIVPFLIWSKRYSKSSGKGKPTLISDLIDLNQSWPVLVAFTVGMLVLTASAAGNWSGGVIGSCILVSLAIVAFCVQILRVLEPAKLGKELWEHD